MYIYMYSIYNMYNVRMYIVVPISESVICDASVLHVYIAYVSYSQKNMGMYSTCL